MDVSKIIQRDHALKAVRDGFWLQVWREVRQYVMPTYSDFLTEGGARGMNIFDTTAIAEKLVDFKDYFSEVTKIIAFAMANSNWATVLIQVLNNLACGLDGIVYCEDGGENTVLNFRSFPVETVCYAENSRGRVDTVFREMTMTSRQLLQEFGNDNLPEKIKTEGADPKQQDKRRKILHAVFPRNDRDPDCVDNRNMPFVDLYIELETKTAIYESGFEEYPFAVCRKGRTISKGWARK